MYRWHGKEQLENVGAARCYGGGEGRSVAFSSRSGERDVRGEKPGKGEGMVLRVEPLLV